jgi:uncharacterized protein YjbI with pentapeptide repeats
VAIALYGFAFFVGMWAIAAWSTMNILMAFGLFGLCIGILWLDGYQLFQLLADLKTLPGTFFEGADLTNTTFEGIILKHTDAEKWLN